MSRALQSQPDPHPRYVVWELTLKCDLACAHCGSRAGRPREAELTLPEALDVVAQLAAMNTYEITFIGGEAYLYPGWLELVRATRAAGMRATMTTGGRQLTPALAQAAAQAGLQTISLSIDGLERTHDTLRRVKGSFSAALAAVGHVQAAGIPASANTQINRKNLGELEALADLLLGSGVSGWQVQLTGPMGRAADLEDTLLQPYEMLELIPRLAAIAERVRPQGLWLEAANNLGYFGPYEHTLRRAHWKGCAAGRYVMGLESNGDVKGCPSLPSGPYVGGNVRHHSLAQLWEASAPMRFTRDRTTEELWGFCQTCYYAEGCRAGCSWTAHTLLGRRGNMPYCHHRAEVLQGRGLRERIRRVQAAPGAPFDFGRFELIEEPCP